jgi:hypothetical protein
VSEFDGIYLLAGMLLIAALAFGIWQITGRRQVHGYRRSRMAEVEVARDRTMH